MYELSIFIWSDYSVNELTKVYKTFRGAKNKGAYYCKRFIQEGKKANYIICKNGRPVFERKF